MRGTCLGPKYSRNSLHCDGVAMRRWFWCVGSHVHARGPEISKKTRKSTHAHKNKYVVARFGVDCTTIPRLLFRRCHWCAHVVQSPCTNAALRHLCFCALRSPPYIMFLTNNMSSLPLRGRNVISHTPSVLSPARAGPARLHTTKKEFEVRRTNERTNKRTNERTKSKVKATKILFHCLTHSLTHSVVRST